MKYDTFLPLAVEIKKVKLSLLEFLSIKKFYKFISSDRSSFTSDSPLPHSEQTPVFCALSKCGDSELPIFNKSTRHRVVLSPKPAKFQQISTIKTNCSPLASVCFQYDLSSLANIKARSLFQDGVQRGKPRSFDRNSRYLFYSMSVKGILIYSLKLLSITVEVKLCKLKHKFSAKIQHLPPPPTPLVSPRAAWRGDFHKKMEVIVGL